MPNGAAYETEYDMTKLVWDQVDIPDDMEQALLGKVFFVNAPRGQQNRPSTKDTFQTWLEEFHPKPGTILAYSYPLLWSYQQLAAETALLKTGFVIDTAAPGFSEQERLQHREKMVSLVFDTVTKCLYEISLQMARRGPFL